MTWPAASKREDERRGGALRAAPDAVVLDFDGVLAWQNTELLRDTCHAVICRHRDFDPALFEDLFASLVPYPVEAAIEFFLSALGLTSIRSELVKALVMVDGGIEAALPFLNDCTRRGIPVRVLSSGDRQSPKYRRARELLGDDAVLADPGFSKLNPAHYREYCRAQGLQAARCWYVDDCPLALQSAKAAGFVTIMMANVVFDEDRGRHLVCVDGVVRDWPSARALLRATLDACD